MECNNKRKMKKHGCYFLQVENTKQALGLHKMCLKNYYMNRLAMVL